MWEFEIIAPNGLTARITLDQMLVELSRVGPVDFMLNSLRKPLGEMYERRDEKRPAKEEASDGR